MRTIKTEFPEFPEMPELAELIALGFIDQSWHNDTCPRITHVASGVIVWLEHPAPEMRESEFADRYCVVQSCEEHPDDTVIYSGESWFAALTHAKNAISI